MRTGQSWLVLGMVVGLGMPGEAQMTRRASATPSGMPANGASRYPSVSADGSAVAYYSTASNLQPSDTNGWADIYCRELSRPASEPVSVDSNEVLGNGVPDTQPPAVSADGNLLVFASLASNLVPGDTNDTWDVFVRNRVAGTIQRVSVSSAGLQGNAQSYSTAISADGRYVAFGSEANNLVAADTNGLMDIFLRDLLSGVTEKVSGFGSVPANGRSISPAISAHGRFVAFASLATNLSVVDGNGCQDIYVRDRDTSQIHLVSLMNGSAQTVNGHSSSPSMSASGLQIAFLSGASNLVAGDTNGVWDVFVRHWQGTATDMVSQSSSGAFANAESLSCSISADGTAVAFDSSATNLVTADTNGVPDVFVRRILDHTTVRASVASNGTQANDASEWPSISEDGRFIAFGSDATNLVPGDTNSRPDVFIRDLDPTGFTSLCHAGFPPVIACPCANPGAYGRGCNNSAGTTGAVLTASGMAYLSTDSLVFTTLGEKPTALSIVLQGTSLISAGVVYGQGVRCVGGNLKRLYTRTASVGSITAPDFGAGEPSVSARSAAKGDTILAGQSRWYLVYYRDGQILGGCPATSTFNTTQTGRVDWLP